MDQVLPEGREAPILLVAPANLDAKITGKYLTYAIFKYLVH